MWVCVCGRDERVCMFPKSAQLQAAVVCLVLMKTNDLHVGVLLFILLGKKQLY